MRVNVGVMTFRLYSSPVRCGKTRFRDQLWGDFSAILEGYAGMADSEGCERNPFARDVFRPKVAYLQNLSEIEKIVCPYRFGPLRHTLLINLYSANIPMWEHTRYGEFSLV